MGARRTPGRKPAASRTDALEARLDGIMSLLETVPGLHGPDGVDRRAVQSLLQEHLRQSVPPLQDHARMADVPQRRSPPRHNLSATNTCSVDFNARRITYSPHEVYLKDADNRQAFAGTMASDPAPAHTSPDYHTQEQQEQRQQQNYHHQHPSPATDDTLGPFPGLSTRDAEDALNRFRLRKVQHFPFVHIPEARVSAYRLRQTRPLLWLSIMACSACSATLQDRLCLRLRQEIAQQAVVHHQRSLDLLLGIVGFLGWGMCCLQSDPCMLLYCHMAAAMVQDLGLDREPPPANIATNTATNATEVHPHGFAIKLLEAPVRTMEERRVVLGAYLVAVLVSLVHRTPIALPWTDHMDECLRVLDAEPETPLDRLLAYQCRLQRIALDIPGPQAYGSIASPREMRMLRDFQVKALVARQRSVEAQMPAFADEPGLQAICRLSNAASEAAIYGVALYATTAPDVERAALLHTCLRLHRAYFDMAFGPGSTSSEKDTDSFFCMFSLHTVTHLSRFLGAVYRLASLGGDDPGCGWDTKWAREQLDIPGIVATLAQRFSEAATHFSEDTTESAENQGGFFSRAARAMEMLRTAWTTTPTMDWTQEPLGALENMFSMGGAWSAWLTDVSSDGQMKANSR